MDETIKQAIAEAQKAFHQRIAPVAMEYKPFATQTQIANELIAIRILLEHAVCNPPKKE